MIFHYCEICGKLLPRNEIFSPRHGEKVPQHDRLFVGLTDSDKVEFDEICKICAEDLRGHISSMIAAGKLPSEIFDT